MRRILLAVVLTILAVGAQALSQAPAQTTTPPVSATAERKIPCKVPENASMCYWTRGRLSFYPIGLPSYRMWKVGTKRILGIYAGPAAYPPRLDGTDSLDIFPANLDRVYELESERNAKLGIDTPWIIGDVYGEFEMCPLEPDRPGTMQPSCIESAKNIFVDLSKHGYQ